jgi:ketosteroid isomerase-like protein
MAGEHPNISLMKKLDLRNLDAAEELFAPNFVWHYFNAELPDIHGDYHGLEGLKSFFDRLGALSKGTFDVEPVSVAAMGDELVVVHVRDTMSIDDKAMALDAVVVWRIVDSRFAEAWDIPAIYTVSNPER